MEELGPVVAGGVLGWLAGWLAQPVWRHGLALAACVCFGVMWSGVVGEFARHWGYAVLDTAQAVIAYAIARWVLGRLGQPGPRRSGRGPSR
jgi:hypothetical protein